MAVDDNVNALLLAQQLGATTIEELYSILGGETLAEFAKNIDAKAQALNLEVPQEYDATLMPEVDQFNVDTFIIPEEQ